MCKNIYRFQNGYYNFPPILGYQFVQSEKMINLLSLIACNKPHHMKLARNLTTLLYFFCLFDIINICLFCLESFHIVELLTKNSKQICCHLPKQLCHLRNLTATLGINNTLGVCSSCDET